MPKNPIVFIHGLWMHSSTWKPWMQFFAQHGYESINPDWPGDGATVEASRANPKAIANHTIKEVADGYAKVIATLPSKPILIGHSFGGLMVQLLLGQGLGVAGIAIDPAPIKGVWQLPLSALKASFPALGNPFNFSKSVSLTHKQFKYGFTNAITEEESKDLYDRFTVPSPARPLFQVAFATFNPRAENKVNTANVTRGPLLITSGDKDHIVPPVLCKAAANKYKKSPAITELKSFANRGHSLALDHGWTEIAEYSLKWLNEKGF
ncbi:MAG TPA: alpha/beta hydrolase [Chitinophagaceae bacterium]|nr:alpha/beta hydrolase [Chitinophagaceae bacterium]